MRIRIATLLLFVLASSASYAQRTRIPEYQPLPAVLSNPISGELGVVWNMSPASAKAALGMKLLDSNSKVMRFRNLDKQRFPNVDSVVLYLDSNGVSFVRVEYRGRDYAAIIEAYRAQYGTPWESDRIVTRWMDADGRWINLFAAQGKPRSSTGHIIVNISRDRPIISDL